MTKKKAGKIDVMFVDSDNPVTFAFVMQRGTLVHGSPFSKNKRGIAFETPEYMKTVGETLVTVSQKWSKLLSEQQKETP